MKPGYLYVLVHPSDPDLYKIGVTVLQPEKRMAQHNRQSDKYAGKVVEATGQKWELKTYIAVTDPYWAEAMFWGATPFAESFGGVTIEVQKMEWKWVWAGLEAAKKAGTRPPPRPRFGPVRNREWMLQVLEGTGITMIGIYRGLQTFVEFQCEKNHRFKESPGLLANRKSCPCCVDWGDSRGPRKGLRATLG
jgi:hypothetical protein